MYDSRNQEEIVFSKVKRNLKKSTRKSVKGLKLETNRPRKMRWKWRIGKQWHIFRLD